MSNPWKRDWSGRDEEGNKITLSGGRVAQLARALWHWLEVMAASWHDDEPELAALRIRHGARAACKRLREERDEARGHYRWMVEHAADQKLDGYRELGARAAAAEDERDAARLELRALEWLVVKGYPHWISRDDTTRIVHGHTGPDWQTVARALGWEG